MFDYGTPNRVTLDPNIHLLVRFTQSSVLSHRGPELYGWSTYGGNLTPEEVDLGPAYLLKVVEIQTTGEDKAPQMQLPTTEELGLSLREAARAGAIMDGQEQLLYFLKKRGFPFPQMVERKVTFDHAEQSVAVLFRIEPGPTARFGPTETRGLKSVDDSLLLNKIPWQEGDLYNADLLAEIQRRLTRTGLFAMVRVTQGKTLDEDGLLPITTRVTERQHRSVGAGISYKTDEGPGVKIHKR